MFNGIKEPIAGVGNNAVTYPAARMIGQWDERGAHEPQRECGDAVPQSRLSRMFLGIGSQWETVG